ncbi:hypothetical protein RI367_001197 [Sorochytrium milnesiophthora]
MGNPAYHPGCDSSNCSQQSGGADGSDRSNAPTDSASSSSSSSDQATVPNSMLAIFGSRATLWPLAATSAADTAPEDQDDGYEIVFASHYDPSLATPDVPCDEDFANGVDAETESVSGQ